MEYGQVHHIEYYVDDLEKSNEFWAWFLVELGYEKYQEWGGGVSYQHKSGTYLVFVQVEKDYLEIGNNRQGNGLNHIAFQGGSLEDLDKIHSDLENRGVKILKRDGDYLCFEDPNQFAVEIYSK